MSGSTRNAAAPERKRKGEGGFLQGSNADLGVLFKLLRKTLTGGEGVREKEPRGKVKNAEAQGRAKKKVRGVRKKRALSVKNASWSGKRGTRATEGQDTEEEKQKEEITAAYFERWTPGGRAPTALERITSRERTMKSNLGNAG